jgi:hypothetical protein
MMQCCERNRPVRRWIWPIVSFMLPGAAVAASAMEELPVPGDTSLLRDEADGVKFTASARLRLEYPERKLIEPDDNDRGLALVRALGALDAKRGAISGLLELGTHRASAARDNPSRTNHMDVQQTFVEFTPERDGDTRLTRMRVGRAEMVYEFVALRDAPNVRRTWDGARLTVVRTGLTANAFAVRLVQPEIGVFDDSSDGADRLSGLHLDLAQGALGPLAATAWYYDVRQDRIEFLGGEGRAETKFAALVLQVSAGNVEFSVGGGRQWGRFDGRDIDAHYTESELGYRWTAQRAPVFLAVRYSAFSGGRSDSDRLATFNPLFPNFAYSTEAALQSPSNLVKAALLAEVEASDKIKLEYRGEALWRYSAADAFYTPVGTPLIPPDGSADRSLGVQQQLKATWKATPRFTVSSAVVHFAPDSFLERAGLSDALFAMLELEAKF